jgi:hypothetical protein
MLSSPTGALTGASIWSVIPGRLLKVFKVMRFKRKILMVWSTHVVQASTLFGKKVFSTCLREMPG